MQVENVAVSVVLQVPSQVYGHHAALLRDDVNHVPDFAFNRDLLNRVAKRAELADFLRGDVDLPLEDCRPALDFSSLHFVHENRFMSVFAATGMQSDAHSVIPRRHEQRRRQTILDFSQTHENQIAFRPWNAQVERTSSFAEGPLA